MIEGQTLYQVLKPAPIQPVGQLSMLCVGVAMNLDSAFELVRQAGLLHKPHSIVIMVCLKSTITQSNNSVDLSKITN